jgi:predicted nucleic acid-binding Zn finger protein
MKKKVDKTRLTLERKAIRRHLFLPSQTEVWTVIGEEGDNVVNDKPKYCTCKDFYFNMLKKKRKSCYHLKALAIAKIKRQYITFNYSDMEFKLFMEFLFKDIK